MKLSKIWKWLTRPHFIIIKTPSVTIKHGYLKEEKTAILRQRLIRGYEDHDKTTGATNTINPAVLAEQEIKKIEKEGLIDYYFDLFLLSRKHQAEFQRLNQKYGR